MFRHWKYITFLIFLAGLLSFLFFLEPSADEPVGQVTPCKEDTAKSVYTRITDCPVPANERASFKGQEIARQVSSVARTQRQNYDIEIVETKAVESGVEVYARAWLKNGTQIGFGKDGTVDLERFVIINPPVLVPDSNGAIARDVFDPDTKQKIGERKYREDTQEALLQVLEHNFSVMKNIHGAEKIVQGKRGNTTTTVFPNDTPESTSVDGWVQNDGTGSGSSYATIQGAATGTGHDDGDDGIFDPLQAENRTDGTDFVVSRSIVLYDTSSIPDTDTIDSATNSYYNNGTLDDANSDSLSLVTSTPASNTDLANADYNQLGTTKQASDIAFSSITTNAYNDFTLNATGLGNISKTGVTKFGLRTAQDISATAPTGINRAHFFSAEETGTTQDPKLVVEHTAVAVAEDDEEIFFSSDL